MYAHKILGISSSASLREIRTAYRRQVKRVHPDHGGDAQQFIQVRQAYQDLLARAKSLATGRWSHSCIDADQSSGMEADPQAGSLQFAYRASSTSWQAAGRANRRIFGQPNPKPSGPPTPKEPSERGFLNTLLFTLVCAGLVTIRTAFVGMSPVPILGLFSIFVLLLGVPGMLAALVGAFDRKRAKAIYTTVVCSLTVAIFFGGVGAIIQTTIRESLAYLVP